MTRRELHLTLTELVAALRPPEPTGLHLTGAELTVPLEVTAAVEDGRLLVLGGVPHSRWVSGFVPKVSTGHLLITAVPGGSDGQ